jgi:hypothetical protein
MQNSYGQHGWKEFHRNRKDILSEFDKILEQTENRPIKVAHGIGVEAYLRKWLSEFLPKKFGVTSGYIIPNLFNDSETIYHFDIIIYKRLDSPILWTEGNEDQNEQGKFRAIPAKHVVAIYEVKSRLTKNNITESLKKLDQTKKFTTQLNKLFTCGVIFIDLKKEDVNNKEIIKELLKGKDIFGFTGGMILRFEEDNTCTGKIEFFNTEKKTEPKNTKLIPLAKPINELKIYSNEEGQLTIAEQGAGVKLMSAEENKWLVSKSYGIIYDEGKDTIELSWSRTYFSDFCINLLNSLEGIAFNDKNRPSFGQIFDKIERVKTPTQSFEKEKGKPFLEVKIYDGQEYDKKINILQEDLNIKITIPIVVENHGDFDVIFSDDLFKTQRKLEMGKFALKEMTYELQIKKTSKDIIKTFQKKNISIPYRLVYYVENAEKVFIAIEKKVIFKNSKILLE